MPQKAGPTPQPRAEQHGDPPAARPGVTPCPPQVLAHSPSPNLAREVEAPLLEPGALELLERTLHPEHYGTWKTLGPAWNRSRWGSSPAYTVGIWLWGALPPLT